jgi:hypothetical protein
MWIIYTYNQTIIVFIGSEEIISCNHYFFLFFFELDRKFVSFLLLILELGDTFATGGPTPAHSVHICKSTAVSQACSIAGFSLPNAEAKCVLISTVLYIAVMLQCNVRPQIQIFS